MGRRAVRGLDRGLVCSSAVGSLVTCWMTAGVGGLASCPSFCRAAVSCRFERPGFHGLRGGPSLRLIRWSMVGGFGVCRDVVNTTVGVGCPRLECDVRYHG